MPVRPSLETVPGWFFPPDVALFEWFLGQQAILDTRGDLAEMGSYMGKSAIVIGAFLRPKETFTVIDLFGSQTEDPANREENVTEYPSITRRQFERNYLRFHPELPTVITGKSHEILDHAAHGRHRFVHIDASHLYDNVRRDIDCARSLLGPAGIVVLDDIRSPHTPGVWAAAWEAVLCHELVPIAVSEHKMYAAWSDAETWQARLLALPPGGLEIESQAVLGRTLLRVWRPEPPPRHNRAVRALAPPAILHRLDLLQDRLAARRG